MICKPCFSKNLVKSGFTSLGRQKFFCKDCKKSQLISDNRIKYDDKVKKIAMILLSESNNYRRIARILNKIFGTKISYQLIIYWVQKTVNKMPQNTDNNRVSRDIAIVEIDELYTFFKKNPSKQEFGLLLTETACVCLHFGQVQERKLQQEGFLRKSHTTK